VSNIAECMLKNWKGLQLVAGHLAVGVPQPEGLGAPALISEGIDPRGKKNIAIPVVSHCTNATKNQNTL
jgi:hypothetical protein